MQGDINSFASTIIHELNIRFNTRSDDVESKNYNLGLETAKTEVKKLLKKWKGIKNY